MEFLNRVPFYGAGVICLDDPPLQNLIPRLQRRLITYGFSANADVRPAGSIGHGMSGLAFTADTPAGPVAVASPLMGKHNISNILTAVGIGTALGISRDVIAAGIRSMKAVPGRMENVATGMSFGVIVDYAHTEDALVRLLDAVREVAKRRVITVFGCGGDRDRTKRPKMGNTALVGSDLVIVTSENRRSEEPLTIIGEIESGMAGFGTRVERPEDAAGARRKPYLVIPDRAAAIRSAIAIFTGW